MVSITACIPFKDRDERLLQLTVDSVLAEGVDEIILCNLGIKPLTIVHEKIVHIHVPLDRWRLGLGYNIAAIHSAGDILLLILADIIIGEWLVTKSLHLVRRGKQFVSSSKFVYRCSAPATARYLRGNKKQTDLAVGADRQGGPNLQGSFCMIDRHDYFRIGGHDSEMQGWGREDVCFHRRARVLGYKRVYAPGMIFHVFDGFDMARQAEEDWQINNQIFKQKIKTNWWRSGRRKTIA